MREYYFTFIVLVAGAAAYENRYTKEANTNEGENMVGNFEKTPFRMGKLNLLWDKAQKRMSENKLKTLYSELKVQDKEEITLKKLKLEGGDKEGLKEAELRKKLGAIMRRYNLSDDIRDPKPADKESYKNEVHDQNILKAVFKDKKLNKLWAKAEQSGFTETELKALKEEFQHHQDKVDEYYALVQSASQKLDDQQNDIENEINRFDALQDMEVPDKTSSPDPSNTIREKHRELKQGYDRLHKVASTGPESKEFMEPKVAGLWKLAVRGDFTQEELESLHTELKHYEHRLLKVRHMTGQMEMLKERSGDDIEKLQSSEGHRILQERLAKQQRKVDKLHEDLEQRIVQRHLEL